MPASSHLILFFAFTFLVSIWETWWSVFWINEWRAAHPDDRGAAGGWASIHALLASLGWMLVCL